jgi:poly(3-hydroxybutyrate) depolymerase
VTLLRAVIVGAAAGALAAAGGGTADTLRSVAAQYYANAGKIASLAGRDTVMDYYQRLLDDADLAGDPPPSGLTTQAWQALTTTEASLDISLATQLLRGSVLPMASIRGLGETLVRSSRDGTLQPLAVYVPRDYSAQRAAPLIVFLHGRLEPESHLLAISQLDDLAEQTHTIVVAPYGRGSYDFQGAESDVYDALDAASGAFRIDAGKRYLAGYSMGGFSAFRIAPMHPADWSAVMSVAGSLLASRAPAVVSRMGASKFYVLTGARDDNVPTRYAEATASVLRDAGMAVTFYSQADGTHALHTLQPILAQAWSDMERGVVRLPLGLPEGATLPEAVR